MELDSDVGPDFEFDAVRNEFTGSLRESTLPPTGEESICLISYEISAILLGAGPDERSGFWKTYRRELVLNQQTDYRNYHVNVCQHQLTSLKMKLSHPIYFRKSQLTSEAHTDTYTANALKQPPFSLVVPKPPRIS